MGYDSLASKEENQDVQSGKLTRLQKQLNALMETVGNLDERLASIESMTNAALLKQQDDIAGLVLNINELKGNKEYENAASKFDMEVKPTVGKPESPVVPPPVG